MQAVQFGRERNFADWDVIYRKICGSRKVARERMARVVSVGLTSLFHGIAEQTQRGILTDLDTDLSAVRRASTGDSTIDSL